MRLRTRRFKRAFGLFSAQRSIASAPSPGASSLTLLPGQSAPGDIIAGVDDGLYLTTLMGFGFNATTGDYSRGAAGFWIRNGELAFPVTEITVSANFDDLWKGVDAVGDDLDTRSSVQNPSFRVGSMMIAGS